MNCHENPPVVLEFLTAEREAGVYIRGAVNEPIFAIFLCENAENFVPKGN
jgi:hypothetical protein